uniref:RCC1 domain-containing protein 1 isoform X2 n=1 Tax=Myxine glutinosa TaxID=7769 RepID=UPI00358FAD5A
MTDWLACGYGGLGQLGDPREEAHVWPKAICRGSLRSVSAGWGATLLHTRKGHLWAKGFVCSKSSHLRVLRGGNDIQAFVCGEDFVLLASSEGLQVWAWPDLFHDGPAVPAWQGAALTDEDAKALPLVPGGYVELHPPFFRELSLPEGVQVWRLALGREHAVLLSFTGQVWTWGSGRHGQLGHGGLEEEKQARLVEALHGLPILEVAAGGWHSLALSCAGDVYSWGWNEAGQLGLPSKMDFIIDPLDPEKPLQIPGPVAFERYAELPAGFSPAEPEPELEPGPHHRILYLDLPPYQLQSPCDVQVGQESEPHGHKHARRGAENDEKEFISIQALPALLDFPHGEDIAAIACGSRHSVAITKCGKLYAWGWGAYGQLGLGDRRSHDEPHCVSFLQEQGLRPCAVICGSWTTFVQVENDKTSA